PEAADSLPRHYLPNEERISREARVRSYLDVNCAHCHMAGGGTPAAWDVRAQLPLAATGLIGGIPMNNGGSPLNRIVEPGDPARSVLLRRIAATGGFTRMPPVGSNIIDQMNVELVTAWILRDLNAASSQRH
ncbi:MAG: hypothetical protein NTV46_00840, partial [Verrucomicrobia bacterium]|nr:hypothetical protein [Verrucomicrobiota bacterium]